MKKRTCKNCRALKIDGFCELGYKVRVKLHKIPNTGLEMRKSFPLKPCSKPLTYYNYMLETRQRNMYE